MSADDLSAWCYECDCYVDGFAFPELFMAYSAVHTCKFGEPPAVPPTLMLELDVDSTGKLSSK